MPASAIPQGVADWFDGKADFRAAGWYPLLPGTERTQVLAWWAEWEAEHPGATPPADAPWIRWSDGVAGAAAHN